MRKGGRRSSAFVSSSSGEQGFWPSYADMMSAVALILFFLMLLSYIQNMITGNNLRGTEQELKDTMAKLELAAAQMESAQKELDLIYADLEVAKADLNAQQLAIDAQQAHIADQEDYIARQQASIASQQELIAQQQAQADRQQEYLTSTQAELAQVRSQMQAVAFLRIDVVNQIRSNIEQVMGNANTVTVSDTGSLVLNESVLFDRGSAELKGASKSVLDQLALGFASFLSNAENTKYVDTIVVGGHADSTGGAELNRKLSTDRANAVLNYLLQTQNGVLKSYSHYFSASGYGDTRPIADNSTVEGQAKNRRIELNIVLKDDSVLDVLNDYLSIEVPDSSQAVG